MWRSIALLLVVLAALGVVLWAREARTIPSMTPSSKLATVTIGPHTFSVEVADTEAARELGLGNRTSLAEGHGMLFVFDAPGNWGFWMKDTLIPLDLLWIRADGTISTIARNVATSTYPEIFYPTTPDAKWVLEVNAGAADDIAEGAQVVVQ